MTRGFWSFERFPKSQDSDGGRMVKKVNPRRVRMVHHLSGYAAIEERVHNVGAATARAIAEDARDMAPIDTGRLSSSIRVVRRGTYTWWVTVGTDYWSYMEYGTRSNYIIRPRLKKALWWRGLASPVSEVTHPGLRPRPFMRPALMQRRRIWFTPTGGVAVVT